jgi:hypothetical protein
MDRKPPKVGTVGDQIALKHELTLRCERRDCRHNAAIDLAAIAAKYGSDFKLQWLIERAVCRKCGARWPELDLNVSPLVTSNLTNGR